MQRARPLSSSPVHWSGHGLALTCGHWCVCVLLPLFRPSVCWGGGGGGRGEEGASGHLLSPVTVSQTPSFSVLPSTQP